LVARIENLIATRRALRASFRAGGGDGAGRGAQAEALGLKTKGLKTRLLRERTDATIGEGAYCFVNCDSLGFSLEARRGSTRHIFRKVPLHR
jgi:hypothetical protein